MLGDVRDAAGPRPQAGALVDVVLRDGPTVRRVELHRLQACRLQVQGAHRRGARATTVIALGDQTHTHTSTLTLTLTLTLTSGTQLHYLSLSLSRRPPLTLTPTLTLTLTLILTLSLTLTCRLESTEVAE